VAEAARNVACTGARPLGITNCLNFGNPERPSVFYQFREACRGIADACRALDTPVTGGNVSFYNESPLGAVDPTPVIGMVGLLARADHAVGSHARAPRDAVFVLGETRAELGASAYWEVLHGEVMGQPPRVDLGAERRLIDFLVTAAERSLLRSAHDCSQGGLAVALAETAMGGPYEQHGLGLDLDLTAYATGLDAATLLFSESHGRAVITCLADRADGLVALAREMGVPVARIGSVGDTDGDLRMRLRDGEMAESVPRLREVYFGALPRRMGD
jgi:phosphoribosylformylglycinamidine synthase